MMLLAALGLGAAIGLVLGALGGGGSVLTVPALVFVLGLTAQAATTASLVIVGITALVAAFGHARSGHVQWRSGLLLAAAGVPASLAGTALNRLVSENVLLLAFAVLMLLAAVGMLIQPPKNGSDAGGQPAGQRDGSQRRRLLWLRLAAAGLLIGALTGFFGVGGGFVIVPVLVVALSFPIASAVGTSLVVIALNAAVALAARIGQAELDWGRIVPFTAAAVLASLVGTGLADRLPAKTLTRAFAVLLVFVAAYVALRAILGLT
jgi:uncharacterized membrane protein YfcA